jgi:hypothetical protein
VSGESENNFALGFVSCGRRHRYARRAAARFFYLWTRQCDCRVLLKRAGATPRTFWAAESRKSGVAPARFYLSNSVTLIR